MLVHCAAGVSRSASTVIAYVMKKQGMSRDDAYAFVKKCRPGIYPNTGFRAQLLKYQEILNSQK